MTTKAKRVKKAKPVYWWAIKNRDGYLVPVSARETRRLCISAWCEPAHTDAPNGGWTWWRKQGVSVVRIGIREIGRNT